MGSDLPTDEVPPGDSMGRRERRRHTRSSLLDAAERLWAERGIKGASLDDVASGAGMTKGAVYSNFTGKTDLLLALMDRYTQADLGLDLISELHSGAAQDLADFRAAGARYGARLDTDEARLLALLLVEFWLYGMRDYAAGWRIADWYQARRERLATELRSADGISAAERATLVLAIDFGLAFQHLLDPDRVPADLYGVGMRLVLGEGLG
jgi:AcrR family transcriptional regulator